MALKAHCNQAGQVPRQQSRTVAAPSSELQDARSSELLNALVDEWILERVSGSLGIGAQILQNVADDGVLEDLLDFRILHTHSS